MNGSAPEPRLLDRSDTRVKHASSLTDVISAFIDRVKAGDLGSLPVIVGLIVIWTGLYHSQSAVRYAEQPCEPLVRLLDSRRHRAPASSAC